MVEGLGAVEQRFETGVRWTTLWIMDDGAVEKRFQTGVRWTTRGLWTLETMEGPKPLRKIGGSPVLVATHKHR